MSLSTTVRTCLVTALLLGAISTAQAARKLRKIEPTRREKDSKDTQASAYSYSAGNDPGGAGDAFTWINAEASASSGYNGVYYNDGTVTVEAGDKAKASWVGAYSKNAPNNDLVGAPNNVRSAAGTNYAIAANLDSEYAFQRGVHTVAGTYLGARAVAGSGSMYGVAKDGIATATIDSYAPTAQDNVAASMTRQERSRSAAVTNIAPKSAAQSGTGNGPAAIASGWEVSSAARAARDKKPPVTLGSRTPEDNGFDRQEAIPIHSQTESKANRRLHRHFVLLRGNPHMQLL
ncbi:hypothetical protein OEZ86_009030 [Tetradesmus obliquus]|nr:hypothetical protein OEZ86_009030 [Tetradesmus obliquus]